MLNIVEAATGLLKALEVGCECKGRSIEMIESDLKVVKLLNEITIYCGKQFEIVLVTKTLRFELRTTFSNQTINPAWLEEVTLLNIFVERYNKLMY